MKSTPAGIEPPAAEADAVASVLLTTTAALSAATPVGAA
jgi:hypothetical protein